jgi:uncharacterized protein YhaN
MQIEFELEGIDQRLRQLSAGVTVEDFIMEVSQLDPDTIDSKMTGLENRIKELNQEKSQLDQTIGRERNELDKMDGSPRAAELADDMQMLLARVSSQVEQYCKLKVAGSILNMAIERYRDLYQDPILNQASLHFQQMTQGAFEKLRADYDVRGRPVIVGIRDGQGEIVGVDGMSDGTADQLFLSLRLAGLQLYLQQNDPMPLILDDILIKFDNDRAVTALQVLAEISAQTQVIFFTHHQHLVDLAEKAIDPSVFTCHTL